MSLGKAIDINAASEASLGAHIELYRAAVLRGGEEQIRLAKLNCESALEARLDAIDGAVHEQRVFRRRHGL